VNQAGRWVVFAVAAMALGCGNASEQKSEAGQRAGGSDAIASATEVPLVPGLTIVTAIVMGDQGDGESVKQITAVDDEAISLTYSADVVVAGVAAMLGGVQEGEVQQIRGRRRVLREDLASAREYMQLFGEALPENIPGSTALGVSAAVLGDLKSSGESALTMRSGGVGTSIGSVLSAFAGPEFASVKEIGQIEEIDKIRGTLRRVEAATVPVRVLVNGKPVDLPAVHARGRLGDRDGDFYFLDDPANPLTLKFSFGEDRLQVVKIMFPEGGAGEPKMPRIEADLIERGRAELYGIHFDFDSDVLRPESKPLLDEIAAVLREHGDWRLDIEGHTDGSGTEEHNMELSRRRAAAVKTALTREYGIADSRLAPSGFGASRPVGSNETVEGRALNRRVELVRK
jgi:outer membrane protein OmpA-like peptidoglycan-associated protein